MSQPLQLTLVAVIIALAAGYVCRSMWNTWFRTAKSGCGSACGKCAAPAPEPQIAGRRPLPMA